MKDVDGATLLCKAAFENTSRISDCLIFFYKQRLAQKLILKLQKQSGNPLLELNKEDLNNVKR